jgi:thioredoxin reductase (NADPH)
MQKLVFDYVIIGAGPVGLYAGTKLSKTKKSFIILEKNKKVGGQPLYIYPEKKITNFPNTKSISGSSVSKKIVGKNKLNIQTKCEVKNIKIIGNKKIKVIAAKDNFICNKVLICSGLGKIEHITIDFLESNPKVIYEITNIKILKDKRIIILGGGDAASDYAAQLKDVCKTITVVYRGDAMKNNRKLEQNVKYYLG